MFGRSSVGADHLDALVAPVGAAPMSRCSRRAGDEKAVHGRAAKPAMWCAPARSPEAHHVRLRLFHVRLGDRAPCPCRRSWRPSCPGRRRTASRCRASRSSPGCCTTVAFSVPALTAATSPGRPSNPTTMMPPALDAGVLDRLDRADHRRPAGRVDRGQVRVRGEHRLGCRRSLGLVAVGLELRDDLDLALERAEAGEHARDALVERRDARDSLEDAERVARLELGREVLALRASRR